MGQFAVGPVDIAPLLEQRQDLGCLIGQHPMHRGPTRGPVSQPATGPPGVPPVGTDLPTSSARQARRIVQPASRASSIRSSSPAFVAASTRRGTRPLSPNRLFLDQRQLHREFLAGLRQPRDLGFRSIQLVIALTAMHTRFGRRQRRQSTILGDLFDTHDRGPVDLLGRRDLGDRGPWRTNCNQISYFNDGLNNRFERRFLDPLTGWFSDIS